MNRMRIDVEGVETAEIALISVKLYFKEWVKRSAVPEAEEGPGRVLVIP